MTFLGNIVMTAGQSKNNRTTADEFSIQGYAGVEVRTTASDVTVELVDSPDQDATTAAATGFPLTANQAFGIAYAIPQGGTLCATPCLACYSAGGATVQVWGLWS